MRSALEWSGVPRATHPACPMAKGELNEEALTESIIAAFFTVYNALGFGFLEYLYAMALERELLKRGHQVAREVWVEVSYDGVVLGKQRLDMVVDHKVVVEMRSTIQLQEAATRQCLNYLRASRLEVGLVLHFGPKPNVHRLTRR